MKEAPENAIVNVESVLRNALWPCCETCEHAAHDGCRMADKLGYDIVDGSVRIEDGYLCCALWEAAEMLTLDELRGLATQLATADTAAAKDYWRAARAVTTALKLAEWLELFAEPLEGFETAYSEYEDWAGGSEGHDHGDL